MTMTTECDFHGLRVKEKDGQLSIGPIYCPVYVVDGTQGEHPDKVLIDDEAYTADTDNEAAKIALLRRVDTELNGLIWTRKVGVVTLNGILSRKGKINFFDVLFFSGPTFDLGRRSDDQVIAARRAAGQPTGLPGDRKLIVPVPNEGKRGYRLI